MHNADPELLKLIRNEVSVANTFLETYRLASTQDHAVQALRNARMAFETATKFVDRLTPELAESFQPDLRRLRDSLSGIAKAKQNENAAISESGQQSRRTVVATRLLQDPSLEP